MTVAIRTEGLTKLYRGVTALRDLDLEIHEGEAFGFIGPNGAGKTTTIRFLTTLLKPTAGKAWINGYSVTQQIDEVKRSIGFMPDTFGVYDGMKVWEFLDFFATAYGLPRSKRRALIDDVLDLTGDEGVVGKSLGTDLDRGKLTLPLIHFMANGGSEETTWVRETIAAGEGAAQATRIRDLLERGLLPTLHLSPDPEAFALAERLAREGLAEAERTGFLATQIGRQDITSEVVPSAWTAPSAGQVYAGVDVEGLLAPFAVVLLAREGGSALRVTGRCLDRPELDGASLAVEVDGEPVLRIPLAAGRAVDERVPLPEPVRARPFFAVRFVADDFVYAGSDLRHCVCFRLDRLAVEP